jgi:hypothetical protein
MHRVVEFPICREELRALEQVKQNGGCNKKTQKTQKCIGDSLSSGGPLCLPDWRIGKSGNQNEQAHPRA